MSHGLLGIRDQGLGIRDRGLGIRDQGVGIRDQGSGIRVAVIVIALLAPGALRAQQNPVPPTRPTNPTRPTGPTRSADPADPTNPIECWWKTDRSAVRVGEPFALTLTCAVLDTERVKVVADESALAPSALHLTPFEVIGGERFRDIPNAPRRFFQYKYSVRLLGEEFFGQEVTLPRLQVSYRVQNSLQGGNALQGREAQYSLTPVPIRVLSLVPAGTADIRDTPLDTFGDVEARLFRSNILIIGAGVAFVFAALMLVMAIARAAIRRRAVSAPRVRQASPMAALRAAARELSAVREAAERGGWTGELAGRAAAALRVAAAVALGRPISRDEVGRASAAREGQIAGVPGAAFLRGRTVMYSASVTPDTPANGRGVQAAAWDPLSRTLRVFTAAHYARNGEADGTPLDAALADGRDAVKKLQVDQLFRLGRRRRPAETAHAHQPWAR